MMRFSLFVAFLLSAAPAAMLAQHGGASPAPAPVAPREATQFDFLVGQWEVTIRLPATSLAARIHGAPKLLGTWKAWRGLDGWGIEDELRLIDASANPVALTHSIRVYDATAKRWSISSLDPYHARFTSGEAEWQDGTMNLTSRGTDPDGKAMRNRTRIYDITPTSFKFQQDRSYDEGKTWTEGTLRIEAKRVAATAPR